MKKVSVRTVSLRFLRLPLLFSVALSLIFGVVFLSRSIPPLTLDDAFSRGILLSNNIFLESQKKSIGVFSLLHTFVKEEAADISRPLLKEAPSKTPPPVQTAKTLLPSPEVKISDMTKLSVKSEDFLEHIPAFLSEDFSVLILHTHTTESYTPSAKHSYTQGDTDRTTDKDFNVVRVGKEIKDILSQNGIKVYHDTTINDYPSYSGSYNRSSMNASSYIKNDPSIKIVLDIHRDAIEGADGKKIKYVSNIDGKDAACIMFVVGSGESGLEHKNWRENMSFSVALQQYITSRYPTLCRPINFRRERFNQHLSPGAVIVEVGSSGNTLDEAILGASYFARCLSDFIKTNKN